MVEFSDEEMVRINLKIQEVLDGKITRVYARKQYNKYLELWEKAIKAHEETYKEFLNFTPKPFGHRFFLVLKH